MVDVRPTELADVDETVDAVEVDERPEVDDVRDGALDDVADVELVDDLLADLLALLLEDRAPREHDVVAVAVHLDDTAVELLPDVFGKILHAADVDQRGREEAADAEVEDEAALDDLDHGALHRSARLVGLLDTLPGLLEARPLLAEDETPVGVFFLHDERVDLLAELHLVRGVDVLADGELVDGDDAFALVSDVDEDLVLVDAHDLSGDDVAFGKDRDGRVVVRHDLAVDLDEVAFAALDDLGSVAGQRRRRGGGRLGGGGLGGRRLGGGAHGRGGGRGGGLGRFVGHRSVFLPVAAVRRLSGWERPGNRDRAANRGIIPCAGARAKGARRPRIGREARDRRPTSP